MSGAIATTAIGHAAIGAGAAVSADAPGPEVHFMEGLRSTQFSAAVLVAQARMNSHAPATALGILRLTDVAHAAGLQSSRFGAGFLQQRASNAGGLRFTQFGGTVSVTTHDMNSLGPLAVSGFSDAPAAVSVARQQLGVALVRFGGASVVRPAHTAGVRFGAVGGATSASVAHAGVSAPLARTGRLTSKNTLEARTNGAWITRHGGLVMQAQIAHTLGMAPQSMFGRHALQRSQKC